MHPAPVSCYAHQPSRITHLPESSLHRPSALPVLAVAQTQLPLYLLPQPGPVPGSLLLALPHNTPALLLLLLRGLLARACRPAWCIQGKRRRLVACSHLEGAAAAGKSGTNCRMTTRCHGRHTPRHMNACCDAIATAETPPMRMLWAQMPGATEQKTGLTICCLLQVLLLRVLLLLRHGCGRYLLL